MTDTGRQKHVVCLLPLIRKPYLCYTNFLLMKKYSIYGLILSLLAVSLAACSTEKRYSRALDDSAQPLPTEVVSSLTAVSPQNTAQKWKKINGEDYVLVVTWKAAKDTVWYKNGADGFYNTGKYQLFVTVAPDLQAWYSSHKAESRDLDLRLKQLLGLPPDVTKECFVEFWVRPQDLIRPCIDAEVNDNACEYFNESIFNDPEKAAQQAWLLKQARDSYRSPVLYQQYPFTQLGYTYDWSPKSPNHVGLSEFVIGANKKIVIGKIYKTVEYLNQK